ncbi:hypothetical protein D9M69_645450 [compost metagenome]
MPRIPTLVTKAYRIARCNTNSEARHDDGAQHLVHAQHGISNIIWMRPMLASLGLARYLHLSQTRYVPIRLPVPWQ